MPERNLKYLIKSDFGGVRSRRGKRKPNQLYVYDTAIQCFDFPRGPHFNKLPVQLILEIFKYLWAYELLRKVSQVCKYWYNLCRDRALWTSITWIGSPGTLGHLLQLTKYQVHELVLTDNLFTFSDKALARLLKKCTHLKCLKLPRNACRELFQRELPRTNILGGIDGFTELLDYLFTSDDDDQINLPPYPLTFRSPWLSHNELLQLIRPWQTVNENCLREIFHDAEKLRRLRLSERETEKLRRLRLSERETEKLRRLRLSERENRIPARRYETDIDIALASVEHKRFLTPVEFLSQHSKGNRFSQHLDKKFSIELKSLECVLQRDRGSRSVRIYETATKSPKQSSIRNIPFQDCRMNIRQHQPCKIKPRPPKGRSNQHKEVRMFRRLQKRFKVYSLK